MKPTADVRKPHRGASRSLAIALDIGTTFSGVSYAILEPGEVPKIHGVTRFPGQEHVAGNSKIPSVMFYDRFGNMKAAGAEAESASILSQAEEEGWTKTELFKLRLRPKAMKLDMNGMRLSPLPRKKTASDVFGDFLSYLFLCTRNFITDTHAGGEALWHAVENDIQFVLSHPNGWEGAQQMKIRRSAIYGGLIPDTDEGKARIRFVTEGEASLHACVLNGLAADVLSDPSNPGFLVVDAGGGTLDISSYAIRGTVPLVIEEIAPPDCIFAGSVFVSHRAREFLREKLKNSKYGTMDSVDHITKRFDETTKRLFRDRKEPQFIPFGSPLDKDLTVGIRGGQLKLTGDEVAELFEPSVGAAVASIRSQIDASAGVIKSVWLVGGFAASPYLFKQLQERLAPMNVTVSRPDSQTSKAVADGAIGFYCDHHVSARMSKFMYGVEYLREFDQRDEEHVARRGRLCELPSGPRLLPDAFDCILARRVKVKESTVFSRKYCTELTNLSSLSVFEVDIWCYRGDNVPKWILRQGDHFSTLCVVRADLSPLSGSAQPKQGKNGKTYWTIVFSVEIHFGLTEFRARIKWVDNGETKYGPATIVYNESGHRADEEEPDSAPEDDATPTFPHSQKQTSKPSSRVPTPGNVTPSGSKEASAFDHPKADAWFGVPEPRSSGIERSTSKTGSSSPYTSHADTDRDGKRQDESVKEKGKEKDTGRSSEKAKEKQKPSRSQPDSIKHGDTLTPEWEPPKTPISPGQAESSKPPNTESVRKETTTGTPKEKDKTTSKTTKQKGQTSHRTPKEGVKTVDFILPTEEDLHDPPKPFSPKKNKSPVMESTPSHPMTDAEALPENNGTTTLDAFSEIEMEKSNATERASSIGGLPNMGAHFDFGGSFNPKDTWSDFGTNNFTHQPSSAFAWTGADSTEAANLPSTTSETTKLDNIPEESWQMDADPFSISHHSTSAGLMDFAQENHVPQNPISGPPSIGGLLSAVHGDSSTLFSSLQSEKPAADIASPLEDKLLESPSTTQPPASNKPTKSSLSSSAQLSLSDPLTSSGPQPSSTEQTLELNDIVEFPIPLTSPLPPTPNPPASHDVQSTSPKPPPAEGETEALAQQPSPTVSPEELLDQLLGKEGAESGDEAAPETSQPQGKPNKKGGGGGGKQSKPKKKKK